MFEVIGLKLTDIMLLLVHEKQENNMFNVHPCN